jgi:drug/metabolite transporter (DMT)-like permease
MAYVLAVGAALANALTSILQRSAVKNAPQEASLRLSLLAYAVRNRVWLVGFATMVAGFLLQAVALHFGGLTEVQPILTLELLFLVIILGAWFRQQLTWREWTGAFSAAAGLAMFLTVASPAEGDVVPDLDNWTLVSVAVVATCTVAVLLARLGSSPTWKAAMFGASAAVMYAFTAALMKQMADDASGGWIRIFTHWHAYAMGAAGLLGLFLTQNAFHSGPVTASQSTLVILDPLASIAIGIGLFGERIDTSGARGPFEAIALVILFAGAYTLSRSPLVASVHEEEDTEGPARPPGQEPGHALEHIGDAPLEVG